MIGRQRRIASRDKGNSTERGQVITINNQQGDDGSSSVKVQMLVHSLKQKYKKT